MPDIEIYTTIICPLRHWVKMLLRAKDADFREISMMMGSSPRREMSERAGGNSIPQIFFDDSHMGYCTRLYTLDAEGELYAKIGLDG